MSKNPRKGGPGEGCLLLDHRLVCLRHFIPAHVALLDAALAAILGYIGLLQGLVSMDLVAVGLVPIKASGEEDHATVPELIAGHLECLELRAHPHGGGKGGGPFRLDLVEAQIEFCEGVTLSNHVAERGDAFSPEVVMLEE
eukprot:CAMPEP_0174747096 /NCGR_PEP_ID=MMETSP1094-20130205/90495_1 /TAXON_ID=156173 /ORGANISM="Chrysochromulina brevifilum, Strain UTEX LB 985" /LENGTH=140 /DNA_ID=CAMNT_0015951911 /DNA_START=182 /DNA_END=604 /DNA_ORIENTATION=-